MPKQGDLTLCECCTTAYVYRTGMSPDLCEECYPSGCMPIERLACEAGKKEAVMGEDERNAEELNIRGELSHVEGQAFMKNWE